MDTAELQVDNSALQRQGHRVGAVVGAELGQNIRHVTFDRGFADRELTGDSLVGITRGNQPQDLEFARAERIIGGVFGELSGDIGRGPRE